MHSITAAHLSDAALVAEVTPLARYEREASVRLIAHLAALPRAQRIRSSARLSG